MGTIERYKAIENILGTYENEYNYIPESAEGEIITEIDLILENFSHGYESYNFDGGPGYSATHIVVFWFENDNVESISFVLESL